MESRLNELCVDCGQETGNFYFGNALNEPGFCRSCFDVQEKLSTASRAVPSTASLVVPEMERESPIEEHQHPIELPPWVLRILYTP